MAKDSDQNSRINAVLKDLAGSFGPTASAAHEALLAGRDTLELARDVLEAVFGQDNPAVTPALVVQLTAAMLQLHGAKLIADQLEK